MAWFFTTGRNETQWTRVAWGPPSACAPPLPCPVSQHIPGPAACASLHAPAGAWESARKRLLTELFTTEFYSRNRDRHKGSPAQVAQDSL